MNRTSPSARAWGASGIIMPDEPVPPDRSSARPSLGKAAHTHKAIAKDNDLRLNLRKVVFINRIFRN